MPELPEVEIVRREISPHLTGRIIKKADLLLPRLMPQNSQKELQKYCGLKIVNIIRRGKYLVLETGSSRSIILHLGMTGRLTVCGGKGSIPRKKLIPEDERDFQAAPRDNPPHTRFIITLETGPKLIFSDARTFGKIFLTGSDWQSHPRLKKLGPEPLNYNPRQLCRLLLPVKNSCSIKALILNQSFLAGAGNIYTDESLFRAGINPLTPACRITGVKWLVLFKCLQQSLKLGIKNFGTTLRDYRRPDGTSGKNQQTLLVYGRGTKPCRACGKTLQKIKAAGRGTVFCPYCQPAYKE
ncbi:MAG: DNA-formamidopyrimidine glycosylase [Spirochaetes bacterium GWF1_41_5]|nr:MAG: DNA-formamidopyrimidine glycosylase [Spirochaetes bacterium GWF1_41_5]HBE01550.1 DNA-formamidopyrimidine glycosylase [Spirochaetia bacterium]